MKLYGVWLNQATPALLIITSLVYPAPGAQAETEPVQELPMGPTLLDHPTASIHIGHRGAQLHRASETVMLTALMVLSDFKSSLNNSIALSSWRTNVSLHHNARGELMQYCHWQGVTCDPQGTGQVVRLQLPGLGLRGTITSTLANLTQLKVLDLSHNMLTGRLPPIWPGRLRTLSLSNNSFYGQIPLSLGRLWGLKELHLDDNWLHGGIPAELANCSQLEVLQLSQNNLTGRIPPVLGDLAQLQVLLLWFNHLDGELPASLGNCSQLVQFEASINWNIRGRIPPEYGRLWNLLVLRLYENQLSGALPPALENCTGLLDLSLFSNHLSGELPSVLGALSQLQVLNLHNNSFTGPIPTSLGNCSSLTEVDLSLNFLSGRIPSELSSISFQSLQTDDPYDNVAGPYAGTLSLRNNSLSRDIPTALGNCSGLRMLYLNFNNLDGAIPAGLENLANLRQFYLTGNKLTGHIPPTFGNLSKLQELYLNLNSLSGSIPQVLTKMANLSTLDLGSNRLEGSIPPSIGFMTALQSLVLLKNRLSGFLPLTLGNCTRLQRLELNSNSLGGTLTSPLSKLLQLNTLNLSDNNFSDHLLPTLFTNLSQVFSLSLGHNQIRGVIPATIGNLSNLQLLNLHGNHLTGTVPHELGALTHLFELDLGYNALQGLIPSQLGNLQALRRLHLQCNSLSGPIPGSLSKCQNLEEIDLSHNNLTGPILAPFRNLQISLLLSHNFLTGPIPHEVGEMTFIQKIDLSANKLYGEIPQSFAECISLQMLNLSSNVMSGSIPAALGDLKNLLYLDLSINNLSGQIPSELAAMPELKFLDVSHNQLVGAIPATATFNHLPAASFSDNEGLCGLPLPVICSSPSNHTSAIRSPKVRIYAIVGGVLALAVFICGLLAWHHRTLLISNLRPNRIHLQDPLKKISFSADELYAATEGYSDSNLLGIGGSSKVYKGILRDGRVVAIKKFDVEGNHDEAEHEFYKECETLGKIRHRNLVPILSTCCNLEVKVLVLEYMVNGSLEQLIMTASDYHKLEWDQVLDIALDVGKALVYLHHECDVPIIHCDLKPSNILLDGDFTAHVADFGIAKLMTCSTAIHSASHFRGSIGYVAPECAELSHYSAKGDVYSFGVILLCMLTRKQPTSEVFHHGIDMPNWVRRFLPDEYLEVLDSSLRARVEAAGRETAVLLVLKVALLCTRRNPASRPSSKQVLGMLLRIRDCHYTANLWRLNEEIQLDQEDSTRHWHHPFGGSKDHQCS